MPSSPPLWTTNTEPPPSEAPIPYGYPVPQDLIMDGEYGNRAIFPVLSINHEGAEICLVAQVHVENEIGDPVAGWSCKGCLGENQAVKVGFVVCFAAGGKAIENYGLDFEFRMQAPMNFSQCVPLIRCEIKCVNLFHG
jgi:hypothetical protein